MSETLRAQEDLREIRSLMNRSGRFLSLSGLSGVWAGLCALAAAAVAYSRAGLRPLQGVPYYRAWQQTEAYDQLAPFLLLLGGATVLAAVAGAAGFTLRRVRSDGEPLWTSTSRRLLTSLAVPLAAGGLLVLATWRAEVYGFTAAITLIFYGLALVQAARYTLDEIRWLGYSELAVGVVAAFTINYSLDAWAFGFGILHIVYGGLMYFRQRRAAPGQT